MADLSAHFAPVEESSDAPILHPSAVVDPTAKIESGVRVGPLCVIEKGAVIARGTHLVSHVFVGQDSSLGEGSVLFPQVTIYRNVKIGARARIHSGTVIGADGFGYAPRIENGKPVGHRKIHHLGGVVIGDDVEIGANSCVDRGTFGDTRIGSHAKIDNLVQIGHNCTVGEGAVLCGSSGMAGSGSVGRFVYVGGGAGIGNQVQVGDYAKIGAYTLVSKSVEAGSEVAGNPMRSLRDTLRLQAKLSRMIKKEKEA
jgi:UDP-3-O-[3-hydroxymyristoyl] glucosamine N-acyltransferase